MSFYPTVALTPESTAPIAVDTPQLEELKNMETAQEMHAKIVGKAAEDAEFAPDC